MMWMPVISCIYPFPRLLWMELSKMFADSPIDIAIHCTKDFLRNDMFPVLPVSSDNRIKHSDDFSDGLTLMTRKVSPIFFFAFCLLPLLGLMNSLFPCSVWYCRIKNPRNSNPSSICVTFVFSGLNSNPLSLSRDEVSYIQRVLVLLSPLRPQNHLRNG